jgi:hypothetical protein
MGSSTLRTIRVQAVRLPHSPMGTSGGWVSESADGNRDNGRCVERAS